MAIYDQLTPLDVLDLLGYGSLNGQARLEALECAAKIRLPSILFDYISAMEENPLLRTSGVILPGERFSFFYDDVSACFERARERRREGIDDEYDYHDYEVFRDLPRSRWPEVKEDYLRIGSDGFYDFGIPVECLGEENPMVFYQLPDCLWFWVDDRRLSTFLRDDFIRILLDDPDNPMAYYEYMLYYDADENPPLTLDEILAKTGWRRQILRFPPLVPARKDGLEAWLQERGIPFKSPGNWMDPSKMVPTKGVFFAWDEDAGKIYAVQYYRDDPCHVALLTKNG